MKTKELHQDGTRTFVVTFGTGDEVSEGLLEFASRENISGASFTGIGAFREATLAFFDLETQEYEEIPVDEQVEVLTLGGNIALHEEERLVHAHTVVGLRDGSTRGGHLLRATVRPTLELVVTETPGGLRRRMDPKTGLPLIDPES